MACAQSSRSFEDLESKSKMLSYGLAYQPRSGPGPRADHDGIENREVFVAMTEAHLYLYCSSEDFLYSFKNQAVFHFNIYHLSPPTLLQKIPVLTYIAARRVTNIADCCKSQCLQRINTKSNNN